MVGTCLLNPAQHGAPTELCFPALQMLGVPTPEVWPGYANLPHRIDFKPAPGQPLQQVLPQVTHQCLQMHDWLCSSRPFQMPLALVLSIAKWGAGLVVQRQVAQYPAWLL